MLIYLLCNTRQAGREPRAFLLPLLAQPHASSLDHFVSYFVPLSERMFDLEQKAKSENRLSEAKVWAVLITQVWAGLPGYCWSKVDTPDVGKSPISDLSFAHDLINPAGFDCCVLTDAVTDIVYTSGTAVLRFESIESPGEL